MHMVSTKRFSSRSDAVEAWNTWAALPRLIRRDDFRAANDDMDRDFPFENGRFVLPPGEEAFGDLTIDESAGYIIPWPRIYLRHYALCDLGVFGDDSMFTIYKLRARWRYLHTSHRALKDSIERLLSENDRDNEALNEQLEQWNDRIADTCLPRFEPGDLRGIDLSGLFIAPTRDRVYLRRVDLSYSDCHALRIEHAYLYQAKARGLHANQLDLQDCTCQGTDFAGSYLPEGQFVRSDLSSCSFVHCLLTGSRWDGANCSECDFSDSMLWKGSFGLSEVSDGEKTIRLVCNLTDARWNKRTDFREIAIHEDLKVQNHRLFRTVMDCRSAPRGSLVSELSDSIEVKPGVLGISVDVGRIVRRLFGNRL